MGVPVTLGVKIYIRRIFPIQNERDERMQRVLVTEAVPGTTLTHIDDCHVLVVQTKKHYPESIDFDKFLLMKIRELLVTCVNKDDLTESVEVRLDPTDRKKDILGKLRLRLHKPAAQLQIYKCYSGKTILDRCSEPYIKGKQIPPLFN